MLGRCLELNEVQKDFLCELGNIGTGHALTSLSGMANITLAMGLPTAAFVDSSQMAQQLQILDGEYMGVRIDAREDLEFAVIMLMNRAFAEHICQVLSGTALGTFETLEDIQKSCLEEIGNILCNAFVNVISTMFSLNIQTTEAKVRTGKLKQVIETIFGNDGNAGREHLLVDQVITYDGQDKTVHIMFQLDPDETQKTLALLED